MKPILKWLFKNSLYIIGCTVVAICVFAPEGTRDLYDSLVNRQKSLCFKIGQADPAPAYTYIKRRLPTSSPKSFNERKFEITVPNDSPTYIENWPVVSAASWDPAILNYLLRKGGDAKQVGPFGYTPLHYAGNYGSCKALLDAGADINALGGLNATPLDCVHHWNVDTIDLLLSRGARKCVGYQTREKVYDEGSKPKSQLSFNGKDRSEAVHRYQKDERYNRLMSETETVNTIIKDAVNHQDRTFSEDEMKVIDLCLDYHPSLSTFTSNNGDPFLISICVQLRPDRSNDEVITSIIKKAVRSGVKVNEANPQDGNTALHYAVRNHCYAAVKALLECGADRNIRNRYGQRPIDLLDGMEDVLK